MPDLLYSQHIIFFTYYALQHLCGTPHSLKTNIKSSFLSLYRYTAVRHAFYACTTLSFQHTDANDLSTTRSGCLCDISGILRLHSYHSPSSFSLRLSNVACIIQYQSFGNISATFPCSTMFAMSSVIHIKNTDAVFRNCAL